MDKSLQNQGDTDDTAERKLDQLAQEYLERSRRGEQPSISEYEEKFPHLADKIRDYFPAMEFLEDLQNSSGDTGAEFSGQVAVKAFPEAPHRLGEYRILRVIGRGGMGVVYEAEQATLGERHVALKVLPYNRLTDPRRIERFQREARAAGRLQHPNIVPVFGVGEENGIHYYAMQYVLGQGLDDVIVDVKRLRSGAEVQAGVQDSSGAVMLTSGSVSESSSLQQCDVKRAKLSNDPPSAMDRDVSRARSNSSGHGLVLNDSDSSHHRDVYFQSIARLGCQVAEALDYAHSEGVLHRDIKPSNLLLDVRGTVWVTDFGLAKEEGDEQLTQSGELVGTLRYMPPERMKGWSDPRSDIYSLGLTLYELLTLQPAYEGMDRGQLMKKIVEDEPALPRRIDSRIPKDLQTVVMKAISKEPAERYQSAAEFVEDLHRFLRDEPVLARPASAVERSWKWARRRPAAAGLIIVGTLALMIVLMGSLWYNSQLQAEVARTKTEEKKAEDSYQKAREVVDRLARMAQDELSTMPFMDRVRRGLLKEVLYFYQGFLDLRGDDPSIRFETARAYLQVGDIQRLLGDFNDATNSLEAGRNLAMDLQSEQPDDPETNLLVGMIHKSLGAISMALGENERAQDSFEMACDIFQSYPQDPNSIRRLIESLESLALLNQDRNPGEAEKLYGEAIKRAATLVLEVPDLPNRIALAGGHGNIVTLLQRSGRSLDALTHCKAARSTLLETSDEDRNNPGWKDIMANISGKFSWVYRSLGRAQDAIVAASESVDFLEQLHKDHPHVPRHMADLASHLSNLGALCEETKKVEQALKSYIHSVTLLEELVEKYSNVPLHRERLARTYSNIVNLWLNHEIGTVEKARNALEKSLALRQVLVDEFHNKPGHLHGLVSILNRKALFFKKTNELEAAQKEFLKAIELQKALVIQYPKNLGYNAYLGGCRLNLANIHFKQGNYHEALGLLIAAIDPMLTAYRGNRDNPFYREGLRSIYIGDTGILEICLILGDHARIFDFAHKSAAEFVHDSEVLYEIAGAVARAIDLAWEDEEISTEAREQAAEEYTQEALHILKSCSDQGFQDFERARDDPHLDSLGDRIEFQNWLSDLVK